MSLPPPRAEDRFNIAGSWKVVVCACGAFVPEPDWPEPYRKVTHLVQMDQGTDGTTRWERWWCSCGAGGVGWPTNHGESR